MKWDKIEKTYELPEDFEELGQAISVIESLKAIIAKQEEIVDKLNELQEQVRDDAMSGYTGR